MNIATDIGRGLFGVIILLGLVMLLSVNRKAINWRLVIGGIGLQLSLGFLILKVDQIRNLFQYAADFFVAVLGFTKEGSKFLFSSIVTDVDSFGFIFAFQVLPTIVFFSALTSLLYYLGILQRIVFAFAWVMSKAMKLSGAESVAAAANVFVGQTEAPLVIKPYIPKMTRSEIMALMTGGMATIAGAVLAAFVGLLGGPDPDQQRIFAIHLLVASIMNAPAALVIAKIIIPETEEVQRDLLIPKENIGSNSLDAIAGGTTQGLTLALNVGAMLLVFIAMIAMLNSILGLIGKPLGLNEWIASATNGRFDVLSMQSIMGFVFAPIAWVIGVSGQDILVFGSLLGEKMVINEFVAYTSLAQARDAGLLLDEKSIIIATYALCGFANFSSIGIQIGGISVLAPEKRSLLCTLGIRAMLGGTIATLLTACIAGMLL
ncbi:MAG TPA: nucleoside transporter C-terminal domain-containing protein [Kiritimatiellia bacterium]|nr:nucleoside transporter C-terminal domain-containing protein [Kiritimatiellia bacterium]